MQSQLTRLIVIHIVFRAGLNPAITIAYNDMQIGLLSIITASIMATCSCLYMRRNIENEMKTVANRCILSLCQCTQQSGTSSVYYDNTPIQYTVIFHGCKNDYFQMKNLDIFLIFAQNIDYGYTLEPPRRGGSNEAVLTSTHNLCFRAKIRKNCKPQFYYIKVGCKRVYISRTC